MTTPRNRSTKFEDHRDLIYRDARRYYARLLGANIMGVDFEDVFGELSLAFVPASRGYDPESQWTFTAYLGICMRNHFNKFAKRLMLEQYGSENPVEGVQTWGLGYISTEDLYDANEDQGEFESVDLGARTPEENCEAASELGAIQNDSTLSAETRVYITTLVDPRVVLSERVKARLHKTSGLIRSEIEARYGVTVHQIRT